MLTVASDDPRAASRRALRREGRDRGEAAASPARVLCVDDSSTFLETLTATLRDDGHDVITARSGEEALDLLALQRVDCILLDIGMPGLDGYEVGRRIRAAPTLRDIPVVLLTAREEQASVLEGLAAGADDYIAKSSTPDVLRARVRAQLRRKRSDDETRRMRDDLLRREIDAAEARAARELSDARAAMVSQLEAQNEELERARDEATRLSQVKSRFLATMSHELRTPLNAIIGFSELLRDEGVAGDPARQQEFVGYIASSGRHLLQLINDILDLSSVEAGGLTLRLAPIDLRQLIDDVGETLQPLAVKGGVNLTIRVDPALGRLSADPVRLRQILYNLLSNGIKFTPSGGSVTLEASRSGAHTVLAVRDTGVGIAAAEQGRLFREFERLGGDDGVEGTGLGLALTRRLVELHGGTIEVESAAAQGSTFRVTLPLGDSEALER